MSRPHVRPFVAGGWTDSLLTVIPTEEGVAAMLERVSQKPDEESGRMQPSLPHEPWSCTVEKVAFNAVIARAAPERLPVILSSAAAGAPRISLVPPRLIGIKPMVGPGGEMTQQSDEVELIRVPGGINAESIVMALRGRGIPARKRGEVVGAIYGLTIDGLGEVSILVPQEYLEEARAILAAAEEGDLSLKDDDSVNTAES